MTLRGVCGGAIGSYLEGREAVPARGWGGLGEARVEGAEEAVRGAKTKCTEEGESVGGVPVESVVVAKQEHVNVAAAAVVATAEAIVTASVAAVITAAIMGSW